MKTNTLAELGRVIDTLREIQDVVNYGSDNYKAIQKVIDEAVKAWNIVNQNNKAKGIQNSRSVTSMARSYLKPEHDSRKSFYNKAETDDDKLYSYGTLVAEIKDGKPVLYPEWDYSATTLRHVKEWLQQNGFEAGSKADIAKRYLTNSRQPIQSGMSFEDAVNDFKSFGPFNDYWEMQEAWEIYMDGLNKDHVVSYEETSNWDNPCTPETFEEWNK